MTQDTPNATRLRVADLSTKAPYSFDLRPDAEARAALARALDLDGLRKLRLAGEVRAEGKRDWRLDATLGATVVQPCVVTLEPVTTRFDVPVTRRFLAEMPAQELDEAGEAEMPEDDSIEPLGAEIDLDAVLREALALHLPLYPRLDGADLEEAVFTEPGVEPMRDEDVKPFAGLAGLRDKLGGGRDSGDDE